MNVHISNIMHAHGRTGAEKPVRVKYTRFRSTDSAGKTKQIRVRHSHTHARGASDQYTVAFLLAEISGQLAVGVGYVPFDAAPNLARRVLTTLTA